MKEICDINLVHEILYDGLCYFDDFCQKNDLHYYLSNGTLLGSAKYNDFIPWDDDIDILMPRNDYDKLMNFIEINNNDYKLFCKNQVPEWRVPYAKLSCEKTIVREGDYDFGAEFGLSLDIFPIDKWSSCLLFAKLQAFKNECLKRMLVCSIGNNFSTNKKGVKRFILYIIWFIGKRIGYSRLQNMILTSVEKSKKYKSKYSGCVVWVSHLDNEILPSEYFDEYDYLRFRERKFRVIKKYQYYLDKLYGKWREELPINQQHSNHEIKVWWKNEQ